MDAKEEFSTPEQYFGTYSDYIKHYYKAEQDIRMTRLECLKIAQLLSPVGTESKRILDVSVTFENYINNGSKRS